MRLIPSRLALMAVQRHAAASRSTRPSRRVQHGFVGGLPMITCTKPSKLAHTRSLRASLGQVAWGGGVFVALARVNKRMFRDKKRASDALLLEAISLKSCNGLQN